MISEVLAFLKFLEETKLQWDVKVAHFDGSGKLLSGDKDISLSITKINESVFYFHVMPIDGYTFLRYPVSPSGVQEDLTALNDGTYSSEHFRYIRIGRLSANGHNNVRVPFIVYGYKTSTLLSIGSPIGPKS